MALTDIICLANSYKAGGRCVAGLRLDGRGWVRPIAPNTSHGQLYESHITLDDGSEPQVLDVIGVDLNDPRPIPGQPENWVIGSRPWNLWERPCPDWLWPRLWQWIEREPKLFGSTARSVPWEQAASVTHSLALVAPDVLLWQVGTESEYRPHARALFKYNEQWYNLALTDPAWTAVIVRNLQALDPETRATREWHKSADAGLPSGVRYLLTVSLGEPHKGKCYKLVAGLVPRPG